jgi:AcrR family transcriptional regulator
MNMVMARSQAAATTMPAPARGFTVGAAKQRFLGVRTPRPTLDRRREAELTDRQKQIIDNLVTIFDDGFADLTMATLAKALKCSLRTLYELATTRDEIMLIGVEQYLWNVGRLARDSITDDMSALEALRAYLHHVTDSVDSTSEAFSRDIELVPAVSTVIERHNQYVFDVTCALLELATENGEIFPIDVHALGVVLAGLGWMFTRAEIKPLLAGTPKVAADAVVDIIIQGLQADVPSAR